MTILAWIGLGAAYLIVLYLLWCFFAVSSEHSKTKYRRPRTMAQLYEDWKATEGREEEITDYDAVSPAERLEKYRNIKEGR